MNILHFKPLKHIVKPKVHFVDMAHQVIMLQTEFVEIPNVRMSRWNFFCLFPPRSHVRILIYQKWRIGSLVIIGLQAKRGIITALFTYKWLKSLIHKTFSIFDDLNAMGNEIKKSRPFFWLVLRLWRPTLVRFFNLDVSSSISLGARHGY